MSIGREMMRANPTQRKAITGRKARIRHLAALRLPTRLGIYRRRQLAAALRAKRPLPSRRQRHLANVALREQIAAEVREQMAANKPQFE